MTTPARIRAQLKRASKDAYAALQSEGLTSGQISKGTGLGSAIIRRLAADGDKHGWRPPTRRTCEAIDAYCRTRLDRHFGLQALRDALDEARGAQTPQAGHAAAAIDSYLENLREVVTVAPSWMPFTDIDDGFQQRMVSVTTDPRGPIEDADVPWASALSTVRIAVVLGDAGYGKTWQARHHVAALVREALIEADPDQSPTPLWMQAVELATLWPGSSPHHALVDAATVSLRYAGMDTRPCQDALATVVEDREAPCVVVVDGYDEVLGQRAQTAAAQALRWLAEWARQGSDRQLVVTSRAAGWTDPVAGGVGHLAPVYLRLGALDDAQVRRLWRAWFGRRSMPVPEHRLAPVLAPGSPLRQFAQIPLIASFCAWVAETDAPATSRAQLFDQVVARFLGRMWKEQDSPGTDLAADDGARRAGMADALADLAWEMTMPGGWADSIDVGRCDAVLRRRGPAAMPLQSLTYEAVRIIGILTQPAAAAGQRLGDARVSWIDRSVHEFLAARRLLTMPVDVVRRTVERAWHDPALAGVLDFALGLEPAPPADPHDCRVRSEVARLCVTGRDPLGYYCTRLTASGRCDHADLDRLKMLHAAGVVSTRTVAQALSMSGRDGDWIALAEELLSHASYVDDSTYEALAWCGAPGRAALARIIAREPAPTGGASTALHRVDPATAVAAIEARVAAGHPVGDADGPCLREVGPATRDLLLAAARRARDSDAAAVALGLTRTADALDLLQKQLHDAEPSVREAAARGLSAWYGKALDAQGFATLVGTALHDADLNLRLATRGTLTRIAVSVPWVERAIEDLFASSDDDALVPRSWPMGPATHKVVAALRVEPRPPRPELLGPFQPLIHAALLGELDIPLTAHLARMIGDAFTQPALARLAAGTLGRPQTINLATAVSLAVPADPAVFDALISVAIRYPAAMLEAAIGNFDLPAVQRVQMLAARVRTLDRDQTGAVATCVDAIRVLVEAMPDDERASARTLCQSVTDHALELVG
ncbi:MAG TPA: NACHT domain-containing protein [Micromonosporaceae bacterium]|jgi:hypothetical protein